MKGFFISAFILFSRKYGFECCNGFKWNSHNGKCEKCPRGFTGRRCELHCVYPSYGDKCQYECRCESALCDPAKGCHVLETTEQNFIYINRTTIRNVEQFNTKNTTDEYQSVTGFKMNTVIYSPLVSGSYQAVLIASISSIVLLTLVLCVVIVLRNLKLPNQLIINVNVNASNTTPEPTYSREVEDIHLSLYESQNVESPSEQDSSFYEELKDHPRELESASKHTYLLVLDNNEVDNVVFDNNNLEEDVYISPLNEGERNQVTDSIL